MNNEDLRDIVKVEDWEYVDKLILYLLDWLDKEYSEIWWEGLAFDKIVVKCDEIGFNNECVEELRYYCDELIYIEEDNKLELNDEDVRDIVKVEWWKENEYIMVFGNGDEFRVELNVMVDWFNNKMKESSYV